MDFTYFMQMLNTSQLYLPRADMLGDPYEGTWPRRVNELLSSALQNLERVNEDGNSYTFGDGRNVLVVTKDWFYDLTNRPVVDTMKLWASRIRNTASWRQYTFVSCWHKSDFESEAMWKLYSRHDFGVAIVSSYRSIRDSTPPSDVFMDHHKMYPVEYIDYQEDVIRLRSLSPFLHKRRSFQHENEVRLVFQDYDYDPKKGLVPRHQGHGVAFDVKLDLLIEKVVVAPFSPDWFFDLVKSEISQHSSEIPIERSELSVPPHGIDTEERKSDNRGDAIRGRYRAPSQSASVPPQPA